MCFIHLRDASRFISWTCQKKHLGVLNACSNGVETAGSLIEKLNGDSQRIIKEKDQLSIFSGHEVILNTQKAKKLGFIFEDNSSWLDEVSKMWKHYLRKINKYDSKY